MVMAAKGTTQSSRKTTMADGLAICQKAGTSGQVSPRSDNTRCESWCATMLRPISASGSPGLSSTFKNDPTQQRNAASAWVHKTACRGRRGRETPAMLEETPTHISRPVTAKVLRKTA